MDTRSESFKQLPLAQRVTIEYRQKLKELVKSHPTLFCSIPEKNLSGAVKEMLEKTGFSCHTVSVQENADLARTVGGWLKKGHIVILRYMARSADTNLIGFLKALQEYTTYSTFSGLIPIFIGSVESDKQLDIFKRLAHFGVRYSCFLSPHTLPERNAEELLKNLVEYGALLRNKFVVNEGEAAEQAQANDMQKSMEYKKLLGKGEAFMRAGNYAEAIEVLSKAIDLGPNTSALMKRGETYYRIKQYMQALNDFREANRLEQGQPDPYAMIGTCCFAIMKTSLKKSEPAQTKKYFDMGMKYLKEAIRITEKLESENADFPEKMLRPPYTSVMTALAEADVRGMKLPGAEAEIDKISSVVLGKIGDIDYLSQETDVYLRIDRAVLLSREGRFDEAEEIFMAILREDPQKVGPAFNNYAVELRNNGELDRSFFIYLEVLKNDIPDREIVVENMKLAGLKFAQELRDNGRLEEAVSIYKKVMMNNPKKKEFVLCEMAVTYLEMQDQAAASSRLMEAIYINPKLTEADDFKKFGDLSNIALEMIKKIKISFLGGSIS